MPTWRPIDPAQLLSYVDDESDAEDSLRRYFTDYPGGRFELFAGGGDRSAVAGQFTSDDVVAVSL